MTKLLTHKDDLESLVIGALLIHPEDIPETSEIISGKDFKLHTFQFAFNTLLEMRAKGLDIEISAIYCEMGSAPGLAAILAQSMDDAVFPPAHYARLLRKRNLEEEIKESVAERDFDIAKEKIKQIEGLGKPSQLYNISDMIEKGVSCSGEIFQTGFTDIDKIVHFRPTNVMVIAGRPSVGKSSFGLTALSFMAKSFPVGLVSFEMPVEGVAERLTENFDTSYLNEINDNFITSCPVAFNLAEIRKSIQNMMRRAPIRVLMIDYLQLMEEPREFRSRHLEVSHIIRQMPVIAKEFNLAIMVISSLSRGTDHSENSRPVQSSLKESGDIEYAADSVIFIHHPKKEKLVEAIVAKNRYKPGKLGIIKLVWLEDRVMFGNYDWKSQDYHEEDSDD